MAETWSSLRACITVLVCVGTGGATAALNIFSPWPETSHPNDLLGKTVELQCTNPEGGVPFYHGLQWLDGSLPIVNSSHRQVVTNGPHNLTLLIHNFSIWDYGTYSCRCVDQYGQIHPSCHQPLADIRLPLAPPSALVNSTFVETQGSELLLTCPETSGDNGSAEGGAQWGRVTPEGVFHPRVGERVLMTHPEDQGKFVCYTGQTVHRIEYIAIKDYLPLKLIHPPSTGSQTIRSLNLSQLIEEGTLCAAFTPYPSTSHLRLYVLEGQNEREVFTNTETSLLGNFDAQLVYSSWDIIHKIVLFPKYDNVTMQQWASLKQQFRCSISNQWESQSVRFYLDINYDATPDPDPTSVPEMSATSYSSTKEATSTLSSSTHVPPMLTSLQMNATSHSFTMKATSYPFSSTPTFSMPTPVTTLQPTSSKLPSEGRSGKSSEALLGVITGVVGLVVLSVLVLGIFVMKRVYRAKNPKRRPAKARPLSLVHNMMLQEPPLQSPHLSTLTAVLLPHTSPPISSQMKKCIQEIQGSEWLFPYEKLDFGEELGSGAFGVVKKVVAHSIDPCDGSSKVVAVKMLKDIASDEDEKDIISELKVLQLVGAYPNIVSLLGVSTHEGKLFIIEEYCAKGSLLSWLRAQRSGHGGDSLSSVHTLVGMAKQVATGMEFLVSKKCIHRDLAARNILVTDDNTAKVADFGLARKMYSSTYRPSGGKMPLKWMAPEAILDGIYTTQSDVWSFGVLLWEIMTLGRAPYPGMSTGTLLRDIEKGYRMPQPNKCPDDVYEIMMKCWQLKLSARPSFTELCANLDEVLKNRQLSDEYYNILSEATSQGDRCTSAVGTDSGLCSYCQFQECSNSDLCSECQPYISTNGQTTQTPGPSLPTDSKTNPSARQSGVQFTFPQPASAYLQLLHEPRVSTSADLHVSSDSLCNNELLMDGGSEPGISAQALCSCCETCAATKRPVLEGYVRPHDKQARPSSSPRPHSELLTPPTELRLGAENSPKHSVEHRDSNDSGVRVSCCNSDCMSETVSISTDWSPCELVHTPGIARAHPRGILQLNPDIEETDV